MATSLSCGKLRRTFVPSDFPFTTTEEVPQLEGIIGQPRAVEALDFGLGIHNHMFHIYVAGAPGTGRTTAVQSFLEKIASQRPTPDDWCYVHNFTDPYRPCACRLPNGKGQELASDMETFIERARQEVPKAFESDEYTNQLEIVSVEVGKQRDALINELTEDAREAGFLIQSSPMGLLIVPVVDNKALDEQAFQALPEETRKELRSRRQGVEERIRETMKATRILDREAQEQTKKLDGEIVLSVVGGLLEDLLEKYTGYPDVDTFLNGVRDDITGGVAQFRPPKEPNQMAQLMSPWMEEVPFRKYRVNVIVGNSNKQGAPVITELNPTYNNLFGRMEKESQFGSHHTDFTLIKAGSLHQANGGYLVLPIEDILRNPFSWDGLKRALRNREVDLEEVSERLGLMTTKSMRPEPIPLNLKVVLIGTPYLYHLLYEYDEDFNETFKVKAHFDTSMALSDENVHNYAAFMSTLCRQDGLRHLEREAVSLLMEESSRQIEDQQKLSTRFADLADLIREADYYAGKADAPLIAGKHVRQAIDARVYRANLYEERSREMIERETILIDTDGTAVGQINGLSVINLRDYAFGRPSRITTTISLGRNGIVDIEREAKLGGPLHSKGVMILSGYLAQRYAQDKPLSLSARLVFEQSYSGIDGDSASSAELYTLLSALSELPLRQDIAVTGSINQRGEIQAIGGVNQKIEGFFDICQAKGLTDKQGVMIPAANEQHLMLREDVVDAVREGQFHVWSVSTADEGIALLTGTPAGERDEDGAFPEGTVNFLVDQRLETMCQTLHEFGNGEKENGEKRGEAQENAGDEGDAAHQVPLESALEIAQIRYAKGDITREEFETIKQALQA